MPEPQALTKESEYTALLTLSTLAVLGCREIPSGAARAAVVGQIRHCVAFEIRNCCKLGRCTKTEGQAEPISESITGQAISADPYDDAEARQTRGERISDRRNVRRSVSAHNPERDEALE
jgi:hypothetical protein